MLSYIRRLTFLDAGEYRYQTPVVRNGMCPEKFTFYQYQILDLSPSWLPTMAAKANKAELEVVFVPPTAHSPNSELPVLSYRNALVDKTLEGSLALIEPNGWLKGGQCKPPKVGEASSTAHFHSTSHECHAVLQGRGTYLSSREVAPGSGRE